jgi:hypothetical protein
MVNVGWRFPPLAGGTRQGYTNNDIEGLQGKKLMDNLAREICQNSLDAHSEIAKEPVRVVFELRYIPTKSYNAFTDYKKCIKGCRDLWKDTDERLNLFLDDADKMLAREKIPVLIASDYNTKGLNGSRTRALKSAWEALTGEDGISVDKSETGAGSFGIGKNAPFACSALSMVFYNTYAESDKEKAFIGVARLASHYNEKNEETQRIGKYQKNDNENKSWTPIYSEDECEFRDLFPRDQYGTDVIIAGFNQEDNWFDNIAKAVIKNFFVAIKENRLVVELKDGDKHQLLNKERLSQAVSKYSKDKEMAKTAQLYSAFVSPDKAEKLSIISENDAEIYIKSDSTFNRTIAYFRDTGMLVELKRKNIFQHYAAVLIVRGTELSKLLRATEPPCHDKWDYKLIKRNSEKQKRQDAKKAIKKIDDTVTRLLKSQFEMVTEDSVDAFGVGEYLPDEHDNVGGASEGNDILKPIIKIGKVKTVTGNPGTITVEGYKAEGAEEPGDIQNHETNPNPVPLHQHPPKPVNPKLVVDDPQHGAAKGKGTKTVTLPNLSAQRAFPIDPSIGLYKIVIKPTETYENLYISCSALGEDGRTDPIEMESFTYNDNPINIENGQAGPIRVQANTPAIFFVKFTNKEKMVLNLHITEVSKKWNQ